MRIVTTQEQLLYDLLQEQKRTNELLEKLVPEPKAITPTEPTQVKETAATSQTKRGR